MEVGVAQSIDISGEALPEGGELLFETPQLRLIRFPVYPHPLFEPQEWTTRAFLKAPSGEWFEFHEFQRFDMEISMDDFILEYKLTCRVPAFEPAEGSEDGTSNNTDPRADSEARQD